MATLKAIRDTYDRDINFKERLLQLVSPTSVSTYELFIQLIKGSLGLGSPYKLLFAF